MKEILKFLTLVNKILNHHQKRSQGGFQNVPFYKTFKWEEHNLKMI
jgi:hypothetical protein